MTTALPIDPRPAPEPALALAREALAQHWDCFWFRADDAPLETRADVHSIIRRLRQHGGRQAWNLAYQIQQCL